MREEERKEDNKWRRMEMRRGKKERTEEGIGRGGRVRKEREKGDRRQDEEEKGGGRVRRGGEEETCQTRSLLVESSRSVLVVGVQEHL